MTILVIGLLIIALNILVVYARFKKIRIEKENEIDYKDRISMIWFIIEVIGGVGEESENTKNYKEGENRNKKPRSN